jgi:DNA topoisomerase-3
MGKILIIAEKPSVASDLAKALAGPLGPFKKSGAGRESYHENDQAIITSAVGHLVELRMPTGPNGKKLPWNFEVLPAIPEQFALDPSPDTETRLKQILKLARGKDIEWIVNACDAGREGELIFRYIMEYGGIRKPVKRLWMQSMTRDSILDAWHHLRSDEEMQPLAHAAKCRSESDWLVGLNATRALTCFRSRHGGFNITAAGRVQTPTLAILAAREVEIQQFKSAPYSEVIATFQVKAGRYEGKWIDEAWKKDETNPHGRAERIWEPALATAIQARCTGKTAAVEEEKKPQSQVCPQLYDLTSLQREASGRFGFSAKTTLQIAQALYEKHKMLTYPRTDSRYLPDDYLGTVRRTLEAVAGDGDKAAEKEGPRLVKSRRVFDSSKVSDHFAIIPTGTFAKHLSDAEQKVFELVAKRFLAVFYPPAVFEVTKRLSRIRHDQTLVDTFRTDGKVLVSAGWLTVYGRSAGLANGKDELVQVAPGETATAAEVRIDALETKPPARYNEATLLSAMEGAGKLVDDEALAEAMAERGLGTPATRAAIIEGLIAQKYVARDGRDLHVTPTGLRLIELIGEMGIDTLKSPSMTGDWECKLRRMEHGQLGRDHFMEEIVRFTEDIVRRAKQHAQTAKDQPFPDLDCPCPKCGAAPLRQTDATFECREPGCSFRVKKHVAGRELGPDEARQLFATGFVGPLDGFKSKFNKPFEAALKMDEKFKVNFVFDRDEPEQAFVPSDEHLLGEVALPDGRAVGVYQSPKAYHVPQLVTESDPEGIRIGRSILQQEIAPEQALKLVREGKSGLLTHFVSKRTGKKFSAFLTLDHATGKLGFAFEERKPRPAKKAAPKDAS